MGADYTRLPVPATEPRQWRFDTEAFYRAIDRTRRERRIKSNRAVLRQAGINTPSTLTRLGQGISLNADTLVLLLCWLGETDMSPYMRRVNGATDA